VEGDKQGMKLERSGGKARRVCFGDCVMGAEAAGSSDFGFHCSDVVLFLGLISAAEVLIRHRCRAC